MRANAIVALLVPIALTAQDPTKNGDLHIAFVGAIETPRGADYVRFLREHFPRVDTIERKGCTPSKLRFADVVVLDWPQSEGVIAWMSDNKPLSCPLGELARWDRPTVLVGSSGLNLAAAWGLPGTFG